MDRPKFRLEIYNNQDLAEFIEKISLIDRKEAKWIGTYEKAPKKRSLRGNSVYWMYIAMICDEMGYDKRNKLERQMVHDGLRELLLPVEKKTILGEERNQLTSTTTLNYWRHNAEFTCSSSETDC